MEELALWQCCGTDLDWFPWKCSLSAHFDSGGMLTDQGSPPARSSTPAGTRPWRPVLSSTSDFGLRLSGPSLENSLRVLRSKGTDAKSYFLPSSQVDLYTGTALFRAVWDLCPAGFGYRPAWHGPSPGGKTGAGVLHGRALAPKALPHSGRAKWRLHRYLRGFGVGTLRA